jgi:hypothetical protein
VNPAACCCLVLLSPVLLYLVTYIFRQACVLCGLPKPSVMTAFGVMLLIWISKSVPEAVMELIISESCRAAGLPAWEAKLIFLFLLLPMDLLISAGLHAGLMSIKFGKGIEVWFVQMLILLSIAAAIAFVAAVALLAMG